MGLRCLHTSIFIKTPSLEGFPTKAKEFIIVIIIVIIIVVIIIIIIIIIVNVVVVFVFLTAAWCPAANFGSLSRREPR